MHRFCLPTFQLKPSHAGVPGHIPLRRVDSLTCFMIETGKPLIIRPDGPEFRVGESTPLPTTAFHETRRVPAFPHLICKEVFQTIERLLP